MLQEYSYIRQEILPALRGNAGEYARRAREQLAVWRGESRHPPLLLTCPDAPGCGELPEYDYAEIHFDREKMFVREFRGALGAAIPGSGAVPSVRSNMGCGVYATLFGLEQDIFPDKMPWLLKHLSAEEIARMTKDDLCFSREFTEALEQMRYMKAELSGTGVELYPLDLQGIVDCAHLVMGNEFFYALYDEPELVHHLMALCVDAIEMGARAVRDIIGPTEWVAHYNGLVLPAKRWLKLSEDTTTLLSRAHIWEYADPHTRELMRRLGGGYIHYCGHNPNVLDWVFKLPETIGFNFGNPEKHDMPAILRRAAESGYTFYGYIPRDPALSRRAHYEQALRAAQDPHTGAIRLLLMESCPYSERELILEDWAWALDRVNLS